MRSTSSRPRGSSTARLTWSMTLSLKSWASTDVGLAERTMLDLLICAAAWATEAETRTAAQTAAIADQAATPCRWKDNTNLPDRGTGRHSRPGRGVAG